ncbi:hypothetical protein [Nitratireductor sp. StC3]|uniref:hypothetical protein n=1 Tax=Nitratireductor sp. StC3 TaxID=2126741 RepID=UPI001304AD92|nr:hypothetical protein [Nitratireductor sp. StC3]
MAERRLRTKPQQHRKNRLASPDAGGFFVKGPAHASSMGRERTVPPECCQIAWEIRFQESRSAASNLAHEARRVYGAITHPAVAACGATPGGPALNHRRPDLGDPGGIGTEWRHGCRGGAKNQETWRKSLILKKILVSAQGLEPWTY